MAIYRCEIKNISRGAGRSCVAAAAYRHAEKLHDDRQDLEHSYEKKAGVEHSEIVSPENAPGWVNDREKLWNTADAAEKRKDARTAKEVLVSLPRELNPMDQATLVRDFAREEFASKGLVADIAIHAPDAHDGEKQPHAHIMLTTRPLENDGFAKGKDLSLDKADGVTAIRERWAVHCNKALERAQSPERVDHRSLAQQHKAAIGIARDDKQPVPERIHAEAKAIWLDRTPEPKIGPVANRMARQGRGHQAHAFRDAMVVREDRGVLKSLSESFGKVKQIGAQMVRSVMPNLLPGLFKILGAVLPTQVMPAAMITATTGPNLAGAGEVLQMREVGKILQQREAARSAARSRDASPQQRELRPSRDRDGPGR